MSFDNPNRPGRRRGLSGPALVALLLVAVLAGTVAWLSLTASHDDGKAGPAAVTVALAPAAAPKATPAPQPTPAPAPVPSPRAATPQQPAAPVEPAPSGTAPAPQAEKAAPAGAAAPAQPAPKPETEAKQAPAPAPEATPKPAPKAEKSPEPAPPPGPPHETATRRNLPEPADGLARAPDPSLIEPSRFGELPRVAPDGRKAWQVYARPFDANDQRPRIAIVMSNLGLSSAATEAAIQRLPGPITLAFSPYARGLDHWIALARAAGHEVLLDLPMEPTNFPANDPGPDTLLTSLTAGQNRTRLHSLLGRVTGYVGVVNEMGSRFTTSAPNLRPVLTELRDRGLLFLDSRSSLRSVAARTATEIGLPRVINNRFIDAEASRDAIDARLDEIERIARVSGFAVGIGQPFPVTIDRLVEWSRNLDEKGFALAPVSAMVNAQPD